MTDSSTSHPQPPVARKEPTTRTFHGDSVVDEYEWLRDKSNPDVIAHLEAENAYTKAVTPGAEALAEKVFEEIRSRVQETDLSVPVREKDFWYYSRTVEGKQYPIFCRVAVGKTDGRPVLSADEPVPGEEVMLDGNIEAEGEEYFSLSVLSVAPDQQTIVYGVDTSGGERYDLRVKNLATGEIIDDAVKGVGYGNVWSLDGSTLFYTRVDDAWRQHQVWRHTVGQPADSDVLVYEETDPKYAVWMSESRDGAYAILHCASTMTTEVRIVPMAEPTAEPVVVAEREQGVEYTVEPAGDRLFIAHNRNHRDFELAVASVQSPAEWRTVIPGEEGRRIEAAEAFDGYVVVTGRRDGLTDLTVLQWPADADEPVATTRVPVDEEVYTVHLGDNPEYSTGSLLYTVESLVTPRTVMEYDLATGETSLLRRQPVLGGYNPDDYEQHRVWATAEDGTKIPMSLVCRKGVTPDGTNPGLLYGYGSYEMSVDPRFSIVRLSYLERGMVYAIAHIRGGGEMGRSWYENGKLLNKKNSFTDFVACAEHLVESGWVDGDRLAAEGRSAGGLLMGAITNLAPERFRVVHAGVAFVDALTTILDPSLPLTVGEWEEWGNPLHDPEVYEYMKSYSPYENIGSGRYPAILATTGLNDTRVFYVEPAKWVQRLREKVDADPQRPICLQTEMVAGHGGKTGRYDAWREAAFEFSFVMDQLGVS